ncbi:hypothetical protein [Asanoa siamensis]|uniref:hypothetical protein n=1 Tax=Asanoa siamensis TaxID=926357 RepID=UPI001941DC45|nr:hypothetical protein [Asanoa siamensis]
MGDGESGAVGLALAVAVPSVGAADSPAGFAVPVAAGVAASLASGFLAAGAAALAGGVAVAGFAVAGGASAARGASVAAGFLVAGAAALAGGEAVAGVAPAGASVSDDFWADFFRGRGVFVFVASVTGAAPPSAGSPIDGLSPSFDGEDAAARAGRGAGGVGGTSAGA